ncbi:hypothetical protein FOVSG1_000495 [Fusarium oxysporum f. sp. vasinfectum]
MSFSVNTLTHGADLRHALRSNKNKGCPIPLHTAMALMFCSAGRALFGLPALFCAPKTTKSTKASRRLCRYVNS